MKYFYSLAILLSAFSAFSQEKGKGVIAGTVFDDLGATYPSAKVELVEVKTILTDMDGKYRFSDLLPGTYTVIVKTPDFSDKIIQGIKVTNEDAVIIDISLTTAVIGEVEFKATTRKENTDQAANTIQKESNTMAEVVSQQTVSKTSAKNVGDVVKMSSGASIQEGKFAVIRGLNDRYNAAFLNGSPLPSTESDRKAFAFDMFPSNMLDNLVISKTATPEMPSEFAGGIIQINTKSIPDKTFYTIGVGGSYNTITTFKPQKTYEGGTLDWLGVDNGTRAMPASIPSQSEFPSNIHQQALLSQQFSTSWGILERKFAPNMNLQFSAGYCDTIFGKEFGIVAAATYSRSFNYNETVRKGYTNGSSGAGESLLDYSYLDQNNNEQVLGGGLANFTIKLNENNNISFKNIYSINSDDKLIYRTGEDNPLDINPNLVRSNARWFTSNSVYSGQLTGSHFLKKANLKVTWLAGYSNVKRVIPSLRRSVYSRLKYLSDPDNPNPMDTVYAANVSYTSIGSNYGGGMFFSENKENSINNRLDLAYSLNDANKIKTTIKFGLYSHIRNRNFSARQLGYTKYGVVGGNVMFDESLLYLPEDQIFTPQNMGLIEAPSPANGNVGKGGFKLTDGSKPSDTYQAQSTLNAMYVMGDNRFGDLHLVYGVRGEYFDQKLQSLRDNYETVEVNTTKLDILPSLNAIYKISETTNLRGAYSQTINRPEYRELAPFAFYDFTTNMVVSGNDSLQRAKIQNFDFRFEKFTERAQMFTASVFFKHFDNPIEQVNRADVSGEITFRNVPSAINYGVEVEGRTLISSIIKADSASVLNDLTLFSNISVIRSKVDVSTIVGSVSDNRPLQGQSPYVVNAGITYTHPERVWSSTLYLNRVGNRIAIVGNVNDPDLWEQARTFLDFQLTYGFWRKDGSAPKAELKLNVQNILAQDQLYYQNNASDVKASGFNAAVNTIFLGDKNNERGYQSGVDDEVWRTNFGRTFSLGLTLKL